MTRKELELAFDDVITKARRADLTDQERRALLWSTEKQLLLVLEPIDDGADAWADIGGARRAAR